MRNTSNFKTTNSQDFPKSVHYGKKFLGRDYKFLNFTLQVKTYDNKRKSTHEQIKTHLLIM